MIPHLVKIVAFGYIVYRTYSGGVNTLEVYNKSAIRSNIKFYNALNNILKEIHKSLKHLLLHFYGMFAF